VLHLENKCQLKKACYYLHFFKGQVVFAAGGFTKDGSLVSQAEIYSPDGKCQHVLSPLPIAVQGLFLVLFNGSAVACSGDANKVSV